MIETISRDKIKVPSLVDKDKVGMYIDNYLQASNGRGRFIFVNSDLNTFRSKPNIETLLRIIDRSQTGVVVTSYENLSRYSTTYPEIPYIVALNQHSRNLHDDNKLLRIEHIKTLRQNNIIVNGVEIRIRDEDLTDPDYLSEIKEKSYLARRLGLFILFRYMGNSLDNLYTATEIIDCDVFTYPYSLHEDIVQSSYYQQGVVDTESYLPQVDILKLQSKTLVDGGFGMYLFDNTHDRSPVEIEQILLRLNMITYQDKDAEQVVLG